MDINLLPEVKTWLGHPAPARPLAEGASLLLRATNNKILFANVMRNLSRNHDIIEYHLRKWYNARASQDTAEKDAETISQAAKIGNERRLDTPAQPDKRTEIQKGKRGDHDTLPEEIKSRYVDNLDILHQMREEHLRLRLLCEEGATATDADRVTHARKLIALDKKYRENWDVYDHYTPGTLPFSVKRTTTPRKQAANTEKACHMMLGQYVKNPTEILADRIKKAYKAIGSPSDRLRKKIENAGLV